MRKNFLLVLTLSLSISAFSQSVEPALFNKINDFLISNVHYGKIDYASVKANPEKLKVIVESLAIHDLSEKSESYKKAFYLNAYNLTVISQVVDNYPIGSPFDVEGFFKANNFKIAGEMMTLDDLEFIKLMEPYKDARVHFALGCAALSCPSLYDNAFRPELVEQQLEFRSQLIIDRPNYVSVNDKSKTIVLNKIFDWYGDQFSYNAGSLINFINKYRHYKVPLDYTIQYQEYDWALNDLE